MVFVLSFGICHAAAVQTTGEGQGEEEEEKEKERETDGFYGLFLMGFALDITFGERKWIC